MKLGFLIENLSLFYLILQRHNLLYARLNGIVSCFSGGSDSVTLFIKIILCSLHSIRYWLWLTSLIKQDIMPVGDSLSKALSQVSKSTEID